MIEILLLAVLVIFASSAQATVSSASSAKPDAAAAEAPADSRGDRAAAAGCPYHFGSDMPADTFCVYRGVALDGGGEVCATDVVVLWSSLASPTAAGAGETSAASREVHVGFVTDPDLVVRAIVDPRHGDRAEMVGFTLGDEEAPRPLAGRMKLRAGGQGAGDVLSLDLREPRRFRPGTCAFASYSGAFLGMIRPASQTTRSVDSSSAPRH